MKILLVEDEKRMAQALCEILRLENYEVETDDSNTDGALFSKQDLTINGNGSLTVTSPAGHGIVCKDDIVITGGNFTIAAASHGIDANDSIRIAGATLDIKAGKDAMHAENSDDSSRGFIYISGADIKAESEGDGIDANGTLEISGGHITVTGPVIGDTATLDYDKSATISGGTFIGSGARGMAQTFSKSAQGVISVSVGNKTCGTKLCLKDKSGNTIIEHIPELDFSVIIISSPDIKPGETYTLTAGTESYELQAE